MTPLVCEPMDRYAAANGKDEVIDRYGEQWEHMAPQRSGPTRSMGVIFRLSDARS